MAAPKRMPKTIPATAARSVNSGRSSVAAAGFDAIALRDDTVRRQIPRRFRPPNATIRHAPGGPMNRVLAALVLTGALAAAAAGEAPPGHRLPEGPQRPLRDRAIDIQHLQATPARGHGARDGGGDGRHHVRAAARLAHRGHPRRRARPRRGQRHPRRLGAAGAGSPAERGAGHAPRGARLAARPHPARHVHRAAPKRPLLLSRRAGPRAAGLELRRGRHPLRLAAPVQRHRRPVHPRPADHRAAAAGRRRQRNARGKRSRTPTGRGRSTGRRTSRSPTT